MILFAGSNNTKLGRAICHQAKINFGTVKTTLFKNSEIRVTVTSTKTLKEVTVLQSTQHPVSQSLFELALLIDSVRLMKAKNIIVLVPYFGYSRQSQAYSPGESISSAVAGRFIELSGASQVVTIDIHDDLTAKYFQIPFINLSSMPLLASAFKAGFDPKNTAIVSPDKGGVKRAREFGEALFDGEKFTLAQIEKKRDQNKIHQVTAQKLIGSVKGKSVIIVDDIITSGSTLFQAAALCRENGAKDISVAITHADFLSGVKQKLISAGFKKVVLTDTIDFDDKQGRIIKLSVAPLLAQWLVNTK